MAAFEKQRTEGYDQPLPGVMRKTPVLGERTLMAEFVLAKDSDLPDHAHPYEQTGYLVKGHIVLRIGERKHDPPPGDSWCIPVKRCGPPPACPLTLRALKQADGTDVRCGVVPVPCGPTGSHVTGTVVGCQSVISRPASELR